jgi:glycosyltransferase involved in cell wall biosynthesis
MSQLIALVANSAWNLYHFRGNLVRRLLLDGYRILIIAPHDDSSQKLVDLGCHVVVQPMDNKGTNPLADLQTMRALKRLYREHQPDLVLHFTIKPVIYGSFAARSLQIPVINTITGLGTAFLSESWLMRIVETLYRHSQRWPTRIFFQNPDDFKLFLSRKLVVEEKSACLPGSGVDLKHFMPAEYPTPSYPVKFLLIARLLRDKGIVEFVDAARHIRKSHPHTRFQLLGPLGAANRTALADGEVASWIEEGIVEYLGETDDVQPFLQVAHCVVLPSYREGTPRALLEAAAVGRPLIATDVPGCREVVDAGVNGLLCDVKNASSLAAAMRQFLDMPLEKQLEMGVAGRLKMEKEFDEKLVIAAYLTEISQLVEK